MRRKDDPLQDHYGTGGGDIPGADHNLQEQDPEYREGGESVYYSEPLIEYAPESNACKAYERLAGEVIAYEG